MYQINSPALYFLSITVAFASLLYEYRCAGYTSKKWYEKLNFFPFNFSVGHRVSVYCTYTIRIKYDLWEFRLAFLLLFRMMTVMNTDASIGTYSWFVSPRCTLCCGGCRTKFQVNECRVLYVFVVLAYTGCIDNGASPLNQEGATQTTPTYVCQSMPNDVFFRTS